MASAGFASLLRMAATGLFVVSAIIYWGAWTPTTAAGLLAAGLACLAGSFLHVPERTANPRARRERERVYDEPLTRERERTTTVR
ncbi:MAG TPA: hypothetical protein VFI37_06790 [Gaiellaceae bacterium]|nr:hypothetical protein [Gaiellaceae bacterium]